MRGAATNEQQQTIGNLAMVTAALARSAALVNETTIISNTVSFFFFLKNQISKIVIII